MKTSLEARVVIVPIWVSEDPVAVAYERGVSALPETADSDRLPVPGENLLRILRAIREAGTAACPDLVAPTEASSQSVRINLRKMEAAGLVEQVGTEWGPSRRGRPARSFRLTSEGERVASQVPLQDQLLPT